MFSNERMNKRVFGCAVAFALIVSFTSIARAQNWPSFRGANASGVADGKPTPTTWDATKGTNDFRHGLYGDVDSDKDTSPHTWHVYCLDKRTGKMMWDRIAYEGVPKIKRHIKSTHNSSTPVTDGKHVIAFFGSEGLYCYDLAGKLIWKKDLGVLDTGWFYDPDY